MTTVSGSVRAVLHDALLEDDGDRRLDSLETTVVMALLRARGLDPAGSDLPTSIEGWVTWVEQSSARS